MASGAAEPAGFGREVRAPTEAFVAAERCASEIRAETRPERHAEHPASWGLVVILGFALACAVGGFPLSARAASASAASNLTTVDTTSGLESVSGRIVDARTRGPLVGVTVRYAGLTRTTSASGTFLFEGPDLPVGQSLVAAMDGYETDQLSVAGPPGFRKAVLEDFALMPSGTFGVQSVRSRYDGLFLSGVGLLNEYTARVYWGTRIPKAVEFSVNGGTPQIVPVTSVRAALVWEMADDFRGSLRAGANTIQVVAVAMSGERSAAFVRPVAVIPAPASLDLVARPFEFIPGNRPAYRFKVELPPGGGTSSGVTMPVPWLDRVGLKFSGLAEVRYELLGGQWDFRAGLQAEGPRLKWGLWEANLEMTPEAKGVASQSRGFEIEDVGLKIRFDARHPILGVHLMDLVPGGQVAQVLDGLGLIGVDPNSIQRLSVNGQFRVDADLLWSYGTGRFKDGTVTPGGGVQSLYAPNLLGSSLEVDLTGRLEFPLHLNPPTSWKVSGSVSLGLKAKLWNLVVADSRWILLSGDITQSADLAPVHRISLRGLGGQDDPVVLEGVALSSGDPGPRLMERDYLQAGSERFVASGEGTSTRLSLAGEVSSLDRFRGLGHEATTPGPAQADLPLVENVFPISEPSVASRTHELMLLYVGDPGFAGDLQRTDIRWTYWNGVNWTAPTSIQTDARGEFAPEARFDGRGNVIAVWQRITNPAFNTVDVTAMAAQMEIVGSRWDRATGQWSVPVALTENAHLDHAPLLCGPLSDGEVLLAWTENTANQLLGTGPVGNAANIRVLGRRWDAATGRWSAPETLVDRLPHRLSQSLAGATNRAVFAWTRDLDGVVTNATDQQVFYVEWLNGAWGTPRQLTSDAAGNRNVRAVVTDSGDVYLAWQKGDDLVMVRNYALPPVVVQTNSASAGFADYALTVGPKGNLVVVWQEQSQEGSDAWYSVYDPASSTWSRDAQLFRDEALERSFAPVWDDVGNLALAYSKVQMLRTNVTVNLAGGGSLTFTNVPQAGRVDLGVLKRRLVRDLAIKPGDLTADAANFMPNAAVTLTTVVRNAGDLAIREPGVAFYDGDPKAGGTLITNIVVSGWLDGAATHEVTTLWVLPEQGTPHTVFAVVDPEHKVEDAGFTTNNVQSLRLGGTDLEVVVRSQTVEANGALRVVAEVRNVGAPKAGASRVALRRQGANGSALVSADVGELEPGRAAQVALDLEAGSVPEGETLFTLIADEGGTVDDVDRSNNISTFAVSLFIDSDGDGMPDGWERQWGLNPVAPADAVADPDGDSLSNLGEYLAGTSPTDPASYLRLTGVAAGTLAGMEVRWGSVPSRLYTLLRSDRVTGGWAPVVEHVQSTAPENRFVDGSVTNAAAFFYRVQVE